MVLFWLVFSALVICAWILAGKEVRLPAKAAEVLIHWKERFPVTPLHKQLALEEEPELVVLEALNDLERGQIPLSQMPLLKFEVSVEGVQQQKIVQCLCRRFPEVEFVTCSKS